MAFRCPRLLQDIAATLLYNNKNYTEVIKYGEEALKYTHLYPGGTGSAYGAFTYPEEIHVTLGKAYQYVADYNSALVHLKAAVKLIEANRGRRYHSADIYRGWIKRIKAGNPRYVPPDPDFEYDDSGLPDVELTPEDLHGPNILSDK